MQYQQYQQPNQYGAYPQAPPQYGAYPQAPPAPNAGLNADHQSCENESLLHENNPLEKFCEREDRMNFVRKVYAIMGVQLLFTAGIVAIPLTNTNAYFWMR